ncbi:MAG: sialate O-acetylesterase [Akkermansiaceae bacterium]
MNICFKSVVVLLAGSLSSFAEIQMPAFFADGMVLQQETGAKVWGFGDAGESVQVEFAGQKLTSKTGGDGKWVVDFKGLKASKKGAKMSITSGKEVREITDVVVGEVWIASGQSNMEWSIRKSDSAEGAKNAKDDLLRIYVTKNVTAATPLNDFKGSWKKVHPDNNQDLTAVGYEYAKILREKLDVPVGIIECAWGGKRVEAYMSDEAVKGLPEGKKLVALKAGLMKRWEKVKSGAIKPTKMNDPELNPGMHSTIYNGMIAPIAGYGARGVIWYQGESNARKDTSEVYGELLKGLILDWRKQWGSDLSFYYVQLANFEKGKDSPFWVNVQDEMRRLLDECEGVGMAVINEIGDKKNIHPRNKKDVGDRLARWALNKDYGMKDIVISGPLYKSHVVKGAAVEVSFSHADKLKARDGKSLGGFEISDVKGTWYPADAEIKGDNVVVSSEEVTKPSNVRYAWKSDPVDANLVNEEGLPTSCFIGK